MKIVILPGWMHTSEHWRKVTEQLQTRGVAAEVLDIPGFGKTPAMPSIATYADLTAWVQQTLEKRYHDEAIAIIGHSFGGRLAISLTGTNLNIKKIILIGSPNLYRPSMQLKVIKQLVTLTKPLHPLVPMSLRRRFQADDYQHARNTPLENIYKEVIPQNQTTELQTCATETLVVIGENDTAVSVETATEITSLLPHATLQILKCLGHNIHLEHPSLLAGIIKQYVSHS